ncbi:GIY-YIG nuclease family protein [soil metagenome]
MPRDHSYYFYILASKSRRLYVGVTNDLESRVWQHKAKAAPGHASRYNIDRLVYFEAFENVNQAIAREKQAKKWRREKKIALIEKVNRTWRDLSARWYQESAISSES